MLKPFFGKRFYSGWGGLFKPRHPAVIASDSALQLSALPGIGEILERRDGLPQGCAGYFLPRPLREDEFLVGRRKELEGLETAFNGWRNGRSTGVAVIGPQGCGKTSLVNCFLSRRPQEWEGLRGEIDKRLVNEGDVLEFFNRLFDLDPAAATVEQVVERLLGVFPRIVVIEGLHNLLLRVVGGRRVLETFMYVVLRTRQRHFWLHTCRLLPWVSMDRHAGISRFFSHIVNMEPLSEEDLRQALRLRLGKCGLSVFYYHSREEYEKEPQLEGDDQAEREGAFYRGIIANSGSNFYAALYFFLLCCRYKTKTQSLAFYPPERLDLAFVKELDRMYLLALSELAGHGVLSATEHQRIFRTDPLRSRIVFELLEQLKLVVAATGGRDGVEKIYDLSPIIHHSIRSVLEQLNLLY